MAAPDLARRTTVFVAKIGTDDAGYNIVGSPQPRLTISTALADLAAGYDAATPAAPKTIALEPGTYVTPAFALPPNVFIEADPDAQGGSNAEVIISLSGNITLSTGWQANTTAVGGFRGVTIRQTTSQNLDFTMPTPTAGNPTRRITLEDVRTDVDNLVFEATGTADRLSLKEVVQDGTAAQSVHFSGGTQTIDNFRSAAPVTFDDTGAIAASIQAYGIFTTATPSATTPGVTFNSTVAGVLARMGGCDNRNLTLNRGGAGALTVYADAISIPLAANISYAGTATTANLIRTTDQGAVSPSGGGITNVQKTVATNGITEDLSFLLSKTLTIGSGGTFIAAAGSTTQFSNGIYTATLGYSGLSFEALTLSIDALNLNVLTLQNTNAGNAFSAIACLGSDNLEHGAFGVGNPGAIPPFANATYIEASYYPSSGTNPPWPMNFVQTGYIGGANQSQVRIAIAPTGDVQFKDFASINQLVFDPSVGRVGVNTTAKPAQPLDVLGTMVVGGGSNTSRTLALGGGFAGYFLTPQTTTVNGSIAGNIFRLVRDNVVKCDVTITGTGASRAINFIDSDNGSVVILSLALTGTGQITVGGNLVFSGGNSITAQAGNNTLTVSGTGTGGVAFGSQASLRSYTVGTLPSASTSGAFSMAAVTNALAPVIGSQVVEGGAAKAAVMSNGTTWTVFAIP